MSITLGRRIIIVGSGGSGKSTLARQLGQMFAIPVIHLDKEFWNSGWVETPKEEWREKQCDLISAPEWIADGNYDGSLEIRLEKADSIIFLDFSRFVCLRGVIKRRLANAGKTRPDMAEGCPEKIDFEFLRWIWQFPSNTRPIVLEKISKYDHVQSFVFKNRRMLKRFLNEINDV